MMIFSFSSTGEAERVLTAAGFSFGTLQRDDPRGLLFGDFIIMKWRNLRIADRTQLDGIMERRGCGPDAPVEVTLYPKCDKVGVKALREALEAHRSSTEAQP